jgi:hypothetical protein
LRISCARPGGHLAQRRQPVALLDARVEPGVLHHDGHLRREALEDGELVPREGVAHPVVAQGEQPRAGRCPSPSSGSATEAESDSIAWASSRDGLPLARLAELAAVVGVALELLLHRDAVGCGRGR